MERLTEKSRINRILKQSRGEIINQSIICFPHTAKKSGQNLEGGKGVQLTELPNHSHFFAFFLVPLQSDWDWPNYNPKKPANLDVR